ncbi:hypothetical protein PSECIP111854_00694 [Pseudoalteromonas sp. CIP111854]|uniref:Transposase n=1 Tax=Pseudoalteromonas holothuriae TaxID=2963714 RepID=A0A9W4QSI6_9GAMM|nr:hypothetical protein PSECIP111854_00694 [Pseudoalteromonas sp. CIP111854]
MPNKLASNTLSAIVHFVKKIFKALTYVTDSEWLIIDGSIVRTHQHSSGAQSKKNESSGKSCGGFSKKIHLAVDSQLS